MFIEVSFKELTGAESAYSATCVNIVAASGYWVNSNMAAPETHRATYLIVFIGYLDAGLMIACVTPGGRCFGPRA